MSAGRRLPCIANPAAGGGRALDACRRAAERLARAGWALEVHTAEGASGTRDLARQLDLGDAPAIAVAGGDGTLFDVLNGLDARGPLPPVAVLPAGSGNSVALDLDLRTPEEAAERLASGARRSIDAMRVDVDGTGHLAVNVVGWGASSRINARAERLRILRGARYTAAAVAELLAPRIAGAAAHLDGRSMDGDLLACITVTRHAGRGMRIAPNAVLDDGELDLTVVRRGGRLALAAVLQGVFDGSHVTSPLVTCSRLTACELELTDGAGLVVDGELLEARRVAIRVAPGAIALLA